VLELDHFERQAQAFPETRHAGNVTILARARAQRNMDAQQLQRLLERVRDGETTVDAAVDTLRHMPFEDLGFAKVDHHRALRHGMPEVILGEGKNADQVAGIAAALLARSPNLLVTRTTAAMAERVAALTPETEHFPSSGVVRVWRDKQIHGKGKIVAVCAGTSDIPVLEEAKLTAEVMGNHVETICDVGVAGIHRLLQQHQRLIQARVAIVCAGMEGALPSVVGGMVSCPVIAVPTSVGYGASFRGLAALLGMLNSCASNVAVVNIDNGFGAGYVASLINRQ
jgi:pyridinium-3,5-biscarboxylic acid mononucleotide synthase